MNERIKSFYDGYSAIFDKDQEEFGFVRVPELQIALDRLKKTAQINHIVLEIGAGTGRFTLRVAPLVSHVTAIDISPKMLDLMSLKIAEKKIANITRICGSFLETPIDEQFDIIMSFSALEYIKDSKALFHKISNHLKPGGSLIVTTAHDTFLRWWGRLGNYFRHGIILDAYSKKRIRKLLGENGIRIVELQDLCLKNFFFKGILLFIHASKPIQ